MFLGILPQVATAIFQEPHLAQFFLYLKAGAAKIPMRPSIVNPRSVFHHRTGWELSVTAEATMRFPCGNVFVRR
jgi:hypothetical protein